MTRFALAVAVACVLAAVAALPAFAGGQLKTTINLDGANAASTMSGPSVSGSATFNVTRSYAYNKDTIWVVNRCWDSAGNQVVGDSSAVAWGMWDSLSGNAGPMYTAGTHCSAYVMVKGQQIGATLNYAVQ